ncbi:hemerythrin domain-containing protein [Ramlibacter humi]|uniref:Hemerythrin-like domain-containing protein n=1 Tax=Ramlibacter humi TaxID=2530451 RepID=A0A4Z0C058_9BURK|nr:hemerythrin domain-containing protein [Ramlibacter humi]TFZ03609.1 hypothetical protein EZ216_08035 [Ramlibacter humi]
MKIDALELQRLAAVPNRLDMYSGIHKAMRACMADALLALGRADLDDTAALAAATQRVLDLMDLCEGHLAHENVHIHRAIEARAPGAADAIAHEHEQHVRHIDALRACTLALKMARPELRPAAAQMVYRELALFVADNFRHMHVEETAHNAVLWAHYTDAELAAIHDALVASIPPEKMMGFARWLVPFLNPAERLGLLGDMRAKAPPPAFEAVLDVVRPHLDDREWHQLCNGLGRPAVPGLVEA